MKVWTISILLLIMIAMTIPFVTAEDKFVGGKIKTPAKVELKTDPLIGLKKLIGIETKSNVEVVINGELKAIVPDNSPILDVVVSEECIHIWPYGTLQWYNCEGGI
jgi:hypothetical protein